MKGGRLKSSSLAQFNDLTSSHSAFQLRHSSRAETRRTTKTQFFASAESTNMCHRHRRHRRGPIVVGLAVAAYKRYQAHKAKTGKAINVPTDGYFNDSSAFQSREAEAQLPPQYEDVAHAGGRGWARKGPLAFGASDKISSQRYDNTREYDRA